MLNRKHLLPMLAIAIQTIASTQSIAQTNGQIRKIDSSAIYEKQIRKMYMAAFDSIWRSDAYKNASANYKRLNPYSNKYISFNLYAEFGGANFNRFNADNAKSGFSPVAGPSYRFGFGFTMENRNRLVKELYVLTLAGDKASYNGGQKIKYSFMDGLQCNVGYDFIKSPRLNIFPYGGLSFRYETLTWHNPGQANPAFTGIADILQQEETFYTSMTGVAYHTGLSIEWVVTESREKAGAKNESAGIMLFARGGTEGMIGNPSFKIRDLTYDPAIRNGQWIATIGFKFFARSR